MLVNSSPPPNNTKQLELGSTNKVLHFATNSFSYGSLFDISQQLGLSHRSLLLTMKASMLRAALTTVSEVSLLHELLYNTALRHQSVHRVLAGSLSPWGWDYPSFAHSLFAATKYWNLNNKEKELVPPQIVKWKSEG